MQDEEDLVSVTGGPLKPHEYVLIKAEMTAGDEAWIQNHAAKSRGQGKDIEIILTLGEVQLATAKRMVKGWNLSKTIINPISGETSATPIPFSPQAIEKLPRAIYKHILKKINDLNPDEEEENDDAFLLDAVDSSEDSFQAERVLRLKH